MAPAFPFSAIVAQDEMKRALLIAAVDQDVGGVLVFGDRGTGKSTAIRALAALMPKMQVVAGCPYNCVPAPALLRRIEPVPCILLQGVVHGWSPTGAVSGCRYLRNLVASAAYVNINLHINSLK
jgi:energy-coupling factor transporter ATP-binding protein EcfA2